jgi:prepilin-type N-terminal cleavage/methylation domain-containing protein
MKARVHDRGFSLIEAMVASVVMLIGLLGLAGLQVIGMRANNLGKRMAQATLLAQDLVQQMQTWDYTDARLALTNNTTVQSNTNSSVIARYWDLQNTAALKSAVDGSSLTFDFTDGGSGATNVNQLAASYRGVLSPVDSTLPAGEQTIYQRYWNVFPVDLSGSGNATGKLVQIVVRWKEARPVTSGGLSTGDGYRQVTTSFFKYDPSIFSN